MGTRLAGRRVLVTQADRYMGPPAVELFRAEGAEVIADGTYNVQVNALGPAHTRNNMY